MTSSLPLTIAARVPSVHFTYPHSLRLNMQRPSREPHISRLDSSSRRSSIDRVLEHLPLPGEAGLVLTTFELARIMGTSVGMIEAHYGALIGTAHDAILARLEVPGG